MPPWTSAGRLERASYCPASGHLPRVEQEVGDAAIWGKVVHEWKETGVWPDDSPYRRSTLDRRTAALRNGGTSREQLWPDEIGVHEFKVALRGSGFDWDTTHRVGTDADKREAWKNTYSEEWVVGIADWFATLDGQPWIDDLKTGMEVPDEPLDLVPMRVYASVAALYTRETVLVSLTHWPRSPADGIPNRVWSENGWTVKQAEKFQKKLERVRLRVIESRDGKLNTVPGPHCKWCPSFDNCPEYAK